MAGRVKGVARVRRLIRRLPEEMRAEMIGELRRAAPVLLRMARAGVPNGPGATGNLRALLSTRVYEKSLRLRVGLIGRAAKRKGFYGYILDVGRKADIVQVRRRRVAGSVLVNGRREAFEPYPLPISPIPHNRYDITFGRVRRQARAMLGPVLNRIYDRALAKASREGGE